jgi:hypothetical protein
VTPTETPGSITWTDALATFTAAGGTAFTYAAGEEYGKLTLTLETP